MTKIRAQTKNFSNPFRIRIFLFLSYSFGIETINTVIHSGSSLENHTRLQTKNGHFRPKRRKNPTRWGGTYLYGLYKGVTYPPPLRHFRTVGQTGEKNLRFQAKTVGVDGA